MCVPLVAAAGIGFWSSLAITAATTATTFLAQSAQANASAQYAQQAAANANESAREQYYLNNLRLQQEQEAGSQQIQQKQRDALKAAATAKTAAGEAGVGGISVDALLADYYRTESQYRESVRTNIDNVGQQVFAQNKGIFAQTKDRINSAASSITPQPSIFGAGLSIAGGALSAYDTYNQRTGKYTA